MVKRETTAPMETRHPFFNRSRLLIEPLAERAHDLEVSRRPGFRAEASSFEDPQPAGVAGRGGAAESVTRRGRGGFFRGTHQEILPILWHGLRATNEGGADASV